MIDQLDWEDYDIAARTVWSMTRDQPFAAQLAVGWVIRNRYEDPDRWPGAIKEIARDAHVFDCWLPACEERKLLARVALTDWRFQVALAAVAISFCAPVEQQDPAQDPTGGATTFHAISVDPEWAQPRHPTLTVGDLRFYKW